jgi:phospholipid N-methyltransferase
MKVLFEDAIHFAYQLKGNDELEFKDTLVARITFEPFDFSLSDKELFRFFKQAMGDLKKEYIILFPYSHLSSEILDFSQSQSLLTRINNLLNQKKNSSHIVPFGLDKIYYINSTGNVFLRSIESDLFFYSQKYDTIVLSNENYLKMIKKMASQLNGNVLEIGSGTGLYTRFILGNDNVKELQLIEKDKNLFLKLRKEFRNISNIDFFDYFSYNKFDFITMSLVYHHIPDDKKFDFFKNCFNYVNNNGKLILGDVFLPDYSNEKERNTAINKFHNYRINNASCDLIMKSEKLFLHDGLNRQNEFKTSYEVLDDYLLNAGFVDIEKLNIGSQKNGGYKIVTATKK